MEDEKKKFGSCLYQAINDSHFSYEEIANKLGLNNSREIYSYVNGEKWPSQIRLLKLITMFNINIDSILGN